MIPYRKAGTKLAHGFESSQGKSVSTPITIFRYKKDGKLVAAWTYGHVKIPWGVGAGIIGLDQLKKESEGKD